jgi:hypothetical protein
MKMLSVEFDFHWRPFGFGLIVSGRELHILFGGFHIKLTAGGSKND